MSGFCSQESVHEPERYVQIYEFWRPDAVGSWNFQMDPFYRLIRDRLKEEGLLVKNWDRKEHSSFLRRSKRVWSVGRVKRFITRVLHGTGSSYQDTRALVFSGVGPHLSKLNLTLLPKEKAILFLWKSPTVEEEGYRESCQSCFSKVYTWNDDLVDNKKVFKFYLPCWKPRIPDAVPYEKKRFLTMIASNLKSVHPHERYSERRRVVSFFEEHPEIEFELYGRFWKSCALRCWKGEVKKKLEVLNQYRFALVYENSLEPGYITEKVFDCFSAGVVPIYSGAPNVLEYLPKECLILREQFQTDEEMVLFLQNMKREEWEGYVNRAGEFLNTEQAKLFSAEHYADTIAKACCGI